MTLDDFHKKAKNVRTSIMSIEIWKRLQAVYDIADEYDSMHLGATLIGKDRTTRDLMKLEIQAYLLTMFARNGGIGSEEIDFVNFYLDTDWKESAIEDLVNDVIPSMKPFVEDSPLCFIVTESENRILKIRPDYNNSLLDVYLATLLAITSKAIDVDMNWQGERAHFAVQYLNARKNYILKNHHNVKCIDILSKLPEENEATDNDTEAEKAVEVEAVEVKEKNDVEALIAELNALIGLQDVKQDVSSLVNLLKIRKIREERGLTLPPLSLHLVFSGNPGTGKTTVARLLAKIYKELGILSKGHLVEVDRSKLVGGYVGQTAIKVQDAMQSALGGILFIDEAYSLTNRGENDYGTEAIDTLVKGMEDNRADLVVIVAGYPELMTDFLNSNPGLRSRFNKFLYFADYNADERVEIFEKMAKNSGYTLTNSVVDFAKNYFENQCANVNETNANARGVRNFFEKAIVNQANRLASTSNYLSDDDLMKIVLDDVSEIE